MGTRLRVPGLVDVLIVRGAGEILAAADHPALDRVAEGHGPILNRLIRAQITRTLRAGDVALPSALPRDDAGRRSAQAVLARRLAPGERPWDGGSLARISAWIGGRRGALGPLCQEAIGRLFVADFQATSETWQAAAALDRALRSRNPLLGLMRRLTGETADAQRTLSRAVGGDAAAVHAIGVAVHTFRRAVERLDAAFGDPALRRTLSRKGMLGGSMAAPDTVVRTATRHAVTAFGTVAPGTLVLLKLDAATASSADPRIAFLSASWSACPADRLVPAMLAEIWSGATGMPNAAPVSARTEPA